MKSIIITAGIALLLAVFVTLSWYPGQLVAGLLFIAFLPGYTLLAALWPNSGDAPFTQPEQWLVAVAVSYGLSVTVLMFMVFARLPLNGLTVVSGLAGITLILAWVAWLRAQKGTPHPRRVHLDSWLIGLGLVVLVAALFRIVNIYYSDHQGDEAEILLRAVSLGYGRIEAMLTHTKGPGEILLLNAIGAIAGQFDEQTVRLPFALAGTAAIGLVALLGRRLFNNLVGLVAGLLAAVEGVLISYARTAQYQSVVLLFTLAALLCFYRFYQTGGRSRRLHGLGAFLLAAAILFHFEAVLLVPVAIYLTLAHLGRPKLQQLTAYLSRLVYLWPSAVIFIVLLAVFYIPFLLHPSVQKTGVYLENRVIAGSLPPFNNLAHFFYFQAVKYNSIYHVVGLNLLLLLALLIDFARTFWDKANQQTDHRVSRFTDYVSRFVPAMAVGLILAGLILVMRGEQRLSAWLLGLGLFFIFGLIIFSRATPLPQRVLWLWIAPSFLTYVVLVNRPGKHHYLFLAALIIAGALAVAQLWSAGVKRWPWLKPAGGRWLTAGLGVMLLLIFAAHAVMLFLRNDLEYILTYPAHKNAFYPTDAHYPHDTRIGFGFPFRLGWQMVGRLKRTGQLEGTWAGNDDGNAPLWYMLNTPPTPCYPDYVLRGEITYKGSADFDVPFDPQNFGYVPRYRIWGNDRLRLTILAFDPLAGEVEPFDLYETAHFPPPVTATDFAAGMKPQEPPTPQIRLEPAPVLGEGSELKDNAPPEYLERAKRLKGQVALIGYDLETQFAQPDGIVPVTLHWQAQNLLSLRYKVFVHLLSADGRVWSQADDFPVCGLSHANSWPPGAVVQDRHLLKLPPDLPPGAYTLLVGMYEPELGLRLNYFDVAGNEQGNSLTAGTLEVRPGS
ncbi:MAG: glycosyltransferase family 39 protein [Anaerolineae bacterium]|nr:glycosyltransferase family 39 protein [Anaerolineae bacterium]